MEGVAGPDRATTPMPTPARWPVQTPVPVNPTRGSKRMAMAMSTPRPNRHSWPSALAQILAAIARVERKLEAKVQALGETMMEGMVAGVADADSRERAIMADAEEREKRVAVKLLATEAIEMELGQKARWELGQWEKLDGLMELRREDLRKLMGTVDGIAAEIAEMRAASRDPAATLARSAAPHAGRVCRRRIPGVVDATPGVASMATSIASRVCGTWQMAALGASVDRQSHTSASTRTLV